MVEVAERVGNQGGHRLDKGSNFGRAGKSAGRRSVHVRRAVWVGLRRANWIQREPFPSSKQRGAAIVNNNFSLATSALDASLLPAGPYSPRARDKIREESFPADISNDKTKVCVRSKTLKVLKPNPIDKAPFSAEAGLKKSTPDPLAVQYHARAMSLEFNIVFDAPILCRCY